MRKIAHISDLHFGAIDPLVLAALGKAIRATAPDVVVVSGDLTQRARDSEFHHFAVGEMGTRRGSPRRSGAAAHTRQ